MSQEKTPTPRSHDRPDDKPLEPLPIWRNTRPRGNPETDRRDLERGRARMEAVLGR